MTERTYYFLGRDGQTRLEHYVEHNDSSLSSPAWASTYDSTSRSVGWPKRRSARWRQHAAGAAI